jgi:hypothetical protein
LPLPSSHLFRLSGSSLLSKSLDFKPAWRSGRVCTLSRQTDIKDFHSLLPVHQYFTVSTAPRFARYINLRLLALVQPTHLPRHHHLLPLSPAVLRSTIHDLLDDHITEFDMSTPRNQPASARPAFAPLQSTNTSHTSSFSSTSSQSSMSSVPVNSPTSGGQHFYGSMNQPTQQRPQQPQGPQRHPSFEYRPNREGAGQTAAETTNYLSQMALLNEAAKRAQMAVVMRDIEGMEL